MTDKYTIPEIVIKGIKKSIEVSKLCKDEDENNRPKVGAVLIKDNIIINTAYRGELEPGEHAEYTLLEKKCKINDFSNTILITTLEPCTRRSSPKKPCAARIVEKGIKVVWIGVNDPNPEIYEKGEIYLRGKGIKVEHFPSEFVDEIIQLNKEFWDNQLKKYKYDLMLVPNQEVITSLISRMDDIINNLNDYLSAITEKEKYILCLGDKFPLIDDYSLFKFNYSNQENEDKEEYHIWSSLDYIDFKSSANLSAFENFLKSIEANERTIHIIKGISGIGKSQLLKHLESYYSNKMINNLNKKIPLLFDLNYWSLQKSIYNYCESKIRSKSTISGEDFKYLLKRGKIIILMDAFNELNDKDKAEFIKDLKNFINLYPGITLVITMTTGTEFFISFEETELNIIIMEEIKIEKFKNYYSKLNVPINLEEFIKKVNLYNLSELVRIPLFFNYLVVYLKVQKGFPSSRYEIINNLINHYFEDFIKKKYNDYDIKKRNFAWQEFLETLSYHMHTKLEDNKIETLSLRYIFQEVYKKSIKKDIEYRDLKIEDFIEFFIKYNILKIDENYYKFCHEILFDYYCGLKIVNFYAQNKKIINRNNTFHKSNLKNPLIIAFPLIKNQKFLTTCKKKNKILYCEGLLEKSELGAVEIDFMRLYLWNLIKSEYFYNQNIAFSLILKLIPFLENKEDFFIKIIKNDKTSRFKSQGLLELGKLKTVKAKEYLLNFKENLYSIRDRGVALCNFEDQETLNLIFDELNNFWFGAGYCLSLCTKFLELQRKNKLSQSSFDKILTLFINPPKELRLYNNQERKFEHEYTISWDYRSGLKMILIEKNDPAIVPRLIRLLDYEKLNYFDIVEVISKLVDPTYLHKIIEIILDKSAEYSRKIPLISIIKNVTFKINFNLFIKFIKLIPEKIENHEEDIFYGHFIELFLEGDHFSNYDEKKLTDFLPKLLNHGVSIQKAVVKVLTKHSPKYFFENKNSFKFYYPSFEILLNVIRKQKFNEMKNFLISHAKMCIPNWMYGVNKSFHNWFLLIDILNILISLDFYVETKELLDDVIEIIDDWKKVNPFSFKIINKFKDSDKMYFITKIYKGYSEILDDDKEQYSRTIFIGTIQPFKSKEYINFNLGMLRESINVGYLLPGEIIRNLIALNLKDQEEDILKIFKKGINENALSQMLRLISMINSKKSLKILKRYLHNKDLIIKNRAFEGIQYKYERENMNWYSNEE